MKLWALKGCRLVAIITYATPNQLNQFTVTLTSVVFKYKFLTMMNYAKREGIVE